MSDNLRDALEKLATKWADQPTDYDEDTEQQIEDGRALRDLLATHPVEPAPGPLPWSGAELSAVSIRAHQAKRRECPDYGIGDHDCSEHTTPVVGREALAIYRAKPAT